jgi:hypothetical protein
VPKGLYEARHAVGAGGRQQADAARPVGAAIAGEKRELDQARNPRARTAVLGRTQRTTATVTASRTERPIALPPILEECVYLMDRDHHIVGLVGVLTCASDQEAVERVERLRQLADLELWQADRRVARIETTDQ